MLKFNANIAKIKFDGKGFLTSLRDNIQTQQRNAAREFVRAAALRVPVYSGMARAAFLPVARYLQISADIKFGGRREGSNYRWRRRRIFGGIWGPPFITKGEPDKTIAEGEARGFDFAFDYSDNIFTFSLSNESEVEQFVYNEFGRANPDYFAALGNNRQGITPPWLSFEVGKAAFNKYIRKNLTKAVPRVNSFISVQRVTS